MCPGICGIEEGVDEISMEAEEVEIEADAGDMRFMKKMMDPRRPSTDEVENHNRTHLPYRNWCPHCVRGRGKDLDHRKAVEEVRGLCEFAFDYCFLGDVTGWMLAVLVGGERTSGMTMASVVPQKGTTGAFAANKIYDYMKEIGCENVDVLVKSDPENTIKFVLDDVAKSRRGARTILEEAPKQSKGSNGIVERAAQSVEWGYCGS